MSNNMSHVIPWTDIQLFHNLRSFAKKCPEMFPSNQKIFYRSKVKLHGSNTAVYRVGSEIICQSRTSILTSEDDYAGFAKFIESSKTYWLNIAENLVVYGEWVGPGIQDSVAVSSIPDKAFCVFAAREMGDQGRIIDEPDALSEICKDIPGVYILPWYPMVVSIDFGLSDSDLQNEVDRINSAVFEIEKEDPWVKQTFGISGTGEGLVFYPNIENNSYESFCNYVFKCKGEKHRVVKSSAPATINPEIASSIKEFTSLVLTDGRLNQGAQAVGGFSKQLIGRFISWISTDLQKEVQDELEASKLTWKQVEKETLNSAKTWYLAKV